MRNSLIVCIISALLPLSAAGGHLPGPSGSAAPKSDHQFFYDHHHLHRFDTGSHSKANGKASDTHPGVMLNSEAHSVAIMLCGDPIASLDRINHSSPSGSTYHASTPQDRKGSTGLSLPATIPTTPMSGSSDYQRSLIIRKF